MTRVRFEPGAVERRAAESNSPWWTLYVARYHLAPTVVREGVYSTSRVVRVTGYRCCASASNGSSHFEIADFPWTLLPRCGPKTPKGLKGWVLRLVMESSPLDDIVAECFESLSIGGIEVDIIVDVADRCRPARGRRESHPAAPEALAGVLRELAFLPRSPGRDAPDRSPASLPYESPGRAQGAAISCGPANRRPPAAPR